MGVLRIRIFGWAQVAYVVVTMADSPRPGVWALEKSMDGGKTWKPWQFFAGTAPSVVFRRQAMVT
jgi:hypothetical protein